MNKKNYDIMTESKKLRNLCKDTLNKIKQYNSKIDKKEDNIAKLERLLNKAHKKIKELG